MRKRKALKGGYKYDNPAMAGPLLKEKLNTTKDDDIKALERSYDQKYKTVENNLKQLMQLRKEANDNYHKKEIENLKQQKQEYDASAVSNKQTKESIIMVANGTSAIGRALFAIGKYFTSIFKFILTTISNAGQGAIIKCIITIVFIILIIVGITAGISGLNNKRTEIKNSSEIGQELLKKEGDDYLNMPKSNDIFTIITDYFYGKIPDNLKYKLNSVSNSISYITTGKNQYEDYLEPREEIANGRSDNIFHINFNYSSNYSKDNTMSIIKPKNVILEFNENLYYDSDYNKIDSNIKVVSNYPQKCFINMKANSKGKYALDLDNIKYYTNNDLIITNSNLIRPIFKYSKIDSNLNIGVKLNSFDNIIYTGYNNANNVLGAYATKLINPNYKGPILRLTNASRDEINTGNENKNGKKTRDFYNDYNTDKLYTLIDNAKIYYDNFFTENKSDVALIYDQSGNNSHLKFEKYNFVHMPEYIKDKDNNYALWFYDQHMLVFTKPIIYKKININTKILFNAISKPKEINDMNFLATKTDEVIQIKGNANEYIVFYTTKNIDNDPDNIKQISDNLVISDVNERWNNNRNPYQITTKYIYNENKEPIILECLGNAYDTRSESTKLLNIDSRYDKNLHDNLKKYSFKGYLYELIIFKSDD